MNKRTVLTVFLIGCVVLLAVLTKERRCQGSNGVGPQPDAVAEEAGISGRDSRATPLVADSVRTGLQDQLSRDVPAIASTEGAGASNSGIVLSARVLDARSLAPVAAVVSWGGSMAVADELGNLELYISDERHPENARLVAHGYEELELERNGEGEDAWSLGTVLMLPVNSVTVRVNHGNGHPAAGATISIARRRRTGPVWASWRAGVTNEQGELSLRAVLGELIIASHSSSMTSAQEFMTGAAESIDLRLESQEGSPCWIGIRDAKTGKPIDGMLVTALSKTGTPRLEWSGEPGPDGVLPVAFPAAQVLLTVPAPAQFVKEQGTQASTLSVDLESTAAGSDVKWVDVQPRAGRWIRFVSGGDGQPVADAIATFYRNTTLPDGQISEVRAGSEPLRGGLLSLGQSLGARDSTLHVVVNAPGFRPFDSRDISRIPDIGEVADVQLEESEAGSFQLVYSSPASSTRGGINPTLAGMPVWLIQHGIDHPFASLRSNNEGLVDHVPASSVRVLVCLTPNRTTAIAELAPEDLYREPPIQVELPSVGQIRVEIEPGAMPHEELEVHSDSGLQLRYRPEGTAAVFDNLPAGRYAVGTAKQLEATRWKRDLEPDSGYPLTIHPGESMTIKAAKSWMRRDSDRSTVSGRIFLDGPDSGLIVGLSEGVEAEHFVTSPNHYTVVGANGDFLIPVGPDTLSLAAGTTDENTGAFVPLAIFAPDEEGVVAKGAHVTVRAATEFSGMSVLELRLKPRDFRVALSLSRGIQGSEGVADFGWIPLGTHEIRPVGKHPSRFTVAEAGLVVLVLQADGTIVLEQ